ncbi:hypothetical protein B0H16DRAFT_1699652 [Mycena metata]|uniref:Homeobox domain-containing protein n=1 Tax=Mycena metata TaxID=1033252 RepID=A0AAD7MKB6_9AGAR|nr:hypothetical protein B0H16DRAFT_1699652 [Mycena metata]
MSLPPTATLLPDNGSTSTTTPALAKRKQRVSKQVVDTLKEYYKTTQRPTKEQFQELFDKINALPGEAGLNTLHSINGWFKRRHCAEKKAASTKPAPQEPPPNPRWPSLTDKDIVDLNACWKHAEPHLRAGLYQSWINSASWEGADKVDIEQWIHDREAQENNLPLPPLLRPPPPPPLRIDTAAASSSSAYAYAHQSLPTPSDTTSPEPFFPESASSASAGPSSSVSTGRAGSTSAYPGAVRYHPYPRLPTPASSRAASLALKSEPASSPVAFMHVTLPPASTSTSTSAMSAASSSSSMASTAFPFFSNMSSNNSSFATAPPTPPPPPTPPSFGTRALQSIKRSLDDARANPALEAPVPTNYAELDAMLEPHILTMARVLANLKGINWDIPVR